MPWWHRPLGGGWFTLQGFPSEVRMTRERERYENLLSSIVELEREVDACKTQAEVDADNTRDPREFAEALGARNAFIDVLTKVRAILKTDEASRG